MDWKKQYAMAIVKNRDWQDLYALVSGRKGCPPASYVKKELTNNKGRILACLNYFQLQEVKPSTSQDTLCSPCGNNWTKEKTSDVTAPFLMSKLHLMTGVQSGLAWEVLSNYLQYAFRGPPDNLQRFLAQNEEKAQAVIVDLFCFYYRERMFILKILYHILTQTTGHVYSAVFSEFIEEHVIFPDLYESLYKQLSVVTEAHKPNLSCLSHSTGSAQRYYTFWMEHNVREQVQLLKLMVVTVKSCQNNFPPISRLKEIFQLIEKLKLSERETSSHLKESTFKTPLRLLVIHVVQLICFDMLTAEDPRWKDSAAFQSVNETVKFLMDRKVDEGSALLAVWFIVHELTPLGTKCQSMKELIAHTVIDANPWKYFNDTLTCPEILEDKVINEVAHYNLYQVAFLSVTNFGLEYVRCDDFLRTVGLLVRDPHVLKHFWPTEIDGLQLVLKECEKFFPVVFQPVMDIYTSVASHSEYYVNEVEKRVETMVKFTEFQTTVINMECLGNNVFRSLEPVKPFVASNKVIIPEGTQCVVTGDQDIFIHWDFSVSIWHIMKENLFRWSQKLTEYPKPSEDEMELLRSRVVSVLSFYNVVLQNRKKHRNVVFFAVDEMFSRIELYHERRDAEMLNTCLKTCTLLLNYYPKDVITLLEVSRAIPDMDKVVLDHIQCAQGQYYHSNGVKTILELVELYSGKFPVLVSYLEFILHLFELPSVYETWIALAGVQFVLRDVFPHYNQWTFSDERQRVRVQWLCIRIICRVLDVDLKDLIPAHKSIMKMDQNVAHVVPTKNLFANMALHHLLNWEPSIALIHIVSLGDQQLFSWIEGYHCWDSQFCEELIGSVHLALTILNKCIHFKQSQNDVKVLTRLEREIYKEPKETDTYRVVINVAGYIYNFLSPEVRYNSVKLISRFADNRHQSLMACIGMEANTMRQMYLKPLYSSTESEEIKVAVLELVTECVHKQASLAEAFLNALQLKQCVQKEVGEESEGFVHIALSILKKRKEKPSDRAFLASVQLLHALWHERRTLVISYIRMRKNFFTNFCYPLFHISDVQRQVVTAYSYILTCLATEMYWYKDQIHPSLKNCITDLSKNHLIRLSLYCTDQLRGIAPEDTTDKKSTPTHSPESTKILIAWKEFIYILAKVFPEDVADKQEILCIHTLNALTNEMSRLGNMLAICTLSELYLLLTTKREENIQHGEEWSGEDKEKSKTEEKALVILKKISVILTQIKHHYQQFPDSAIYNILASSCNFFSSTYFPRYMSPSWELPTESIIRATCSLLSEVLKGNTKRSKHILSSLLCLGISLGQVMAGRNAQMWCEVFSEYRITSQLVDATAAALQTKDMTGTSLLMLEFLIVLSLDDEHTLKEVDTLELHSAWDSLKPPIQTLFGQIPVCLQERSVFEATNWYSVYVRALNLVTTLVKHSCPNTRDLAFDFIYQHEKFICDIFEFKEDSLKENALELCKSALRLLWHSIQLVLPWNWKIKSTLGRILVKVKQYISSLVDLIGDPESLSRHNALAHHLNTFPPPQPNIKDTYRELQQLQNRLLGVLIECMAVLKETCPLYTDLLAADRLGLPMSSLHLLVEPCPPADTGPEYYTLINLTNLVSKRLASNLRISPRSSSIPIGPSSDKADDRMNKPQEINDTTSSLEVSGNDDLYLAVKLSGCTQKDLKLALELTVHYMISNTLLTILSNQMGFHQSVVFLRDLSTEAKTFLEYAQRLHYGKEGNWSWLQQTVQVEGYTPLTWCFSDVIEMDDSVTLGCVALPDADSDNECSFQGTTSSDNSYERHSKKVKTNESNKLKNLKQFLPNTIILDSTFQPNQKPRKYLGNTDEDVSTDFILFCNHILKQVFGVHGFYERSSLKGGL